MPRAWACSTSVDQVLAGAEPLVDLEEVLDAVAVVGVAAGPLLKHRADPQGGDPEPAQVVQPAADAVERAALPPLPGIRPRLQLQPGRSGWVAQGPDLGTGEERAIRPPGRR